MRNKRMKENDLIMDKYFRIEYYDKTNKFAKHIIVSADNIEQCINCYDNDRYPIIRIYKCNKNGNNYSGRLIYTKIG